MYVPSLDAILSNLGMTKSEFEAAKTVEIPSSLLTFLLRIALANSDFSETSYLAANPDVAAASKKGTVQNPRLHYIGDGYFEGRQGGMPDLDEKWYLRSYPDVAEAVRRRTTQSAAQHFWNVGAAEFRAPAEAYLSDAVHWGKAFGKGE
jgi:hypothetical protein